MKNIFIYAIICLFTNLLNAQTQIRIKVSKLAINNSTKEYSKDSLVKELVVREEIVYVTLDTLDGRPFTLQIMPVTVQSDTGFGYAYCASASWESPDRFQPNMFCTTSQPSHIGVSSLSEKGEIWKYEYDLLYSVECKSKPSSMVKIVHIKPVQAKVLCTGMNLTIQNQSISTKKWRKAERLIEGIPTDTAWINGKKGLRYGLVKKLSVVYFNGVPSYSVDFMLYEKNTTGSKLLNTLKTTLHPGITTSTGIGGNATVHLELKQLGIVPL